MISNPGAEASTCALCGGRLAPGLATIPFIRGERVITLKGLPAEVCGDCDEAYLAGDVVDRVQAIVEELEGLDAEVLVARYRAA
jgi:YgiT-type zinc finger domain-containing protein